MIRTETEGRVRRIVLASPETKNVLDSALAEALMHELFEAESNSGIGAILLTAEGPVFCGGYEVGAELPEEIFTFGKYAKTPIVAAVQGVALSAGLALIANAHVAFAAQGSSFGLTDIREARYHAGIFDAVASAVGQRRAQELALTGRVFSTPEAVAWGLIHAVTPAFELEERATATAASLANADHETVQAILRPIETN